MINDKEALKRIVARFESQWQGVAQGAIQRMYELMDRGMKVEAAVNQLRMEFPELFNLAGLEDSLVEAAAYGYGIMPSVLADAEKSYLKKIISKPWSADGMTLSEKIHSADQKIHKAIRDTVQTQINKNATAKEVAMELYDGYNSGKAVVLEQDIPKYLSKIRHAVGDRESNGDIRRALENVSRLSRNGAPNRALKAAYSKFIDAVENGNKAAIDKAVYVAIQEKSRYVAERIARTEMARAYADGFFSQHQNDPDVVGYQFELGTRHPAFDICDMYAKCNMFNLGKGVYPKDKVPLIPTHPHCLCTYHVLYEGQIDLGKRRNQQNSAMARWVGGLPEQQAVKVLGREGYAVYKASQRPTTARNTAGGSDYMAERNKTLWQGYLRNYEGLRSPQYREINLFENNEKPLQNNADSGIIISNDVYHRRTENIGAFKELELVVNRRSVKSVIREYGINMKGIRIQIDAQHEMIGKGYCGEADPDDIGRIRIFADAFSNKEEMARTLIHEKMHVLQLLKYGKEYCDYNLSKIEKQAHRAESLYLYVLHKRSKK